MNAIEEAIAAELTLSYVQAGRHVSGDNVVVVSKSLKDALGFDSVEEVRDTFRRARNMEDVPTQRVLCEALRNHRAENIPQPYTPLIAEKTTEDTRPITFEEKQYIFAWWHLHGTKFQFLTDEKAKQIVDKFEGDPKHEEFTRYQNAKWTPVAYRNVKVYGETTMKAGML